MAFEGLSEKLSAVFKKLRGKGKLSENDVKQVARKSKSRFWKRTLNYKVVKDFIAAVSGRAVGAEVLESLTPPQQVVKIVNEELILPHGKRAKQAFDFLQASHRRNAGRAAGRRENDPHRKACRSV